MKTLSEQQIIDLFLAGRTIILFNESGTISCKKGLLTIEQFKDYLSKNNKEGRILWRPFYLSINSNNYHLDY